ncbi:hypothetical protein MNV49_003954 [Pseudohyphozyma bogoriensis]|nr:hypothetical protein MNV49_003954 [Pseudohyphozyma bogoriensis]
MPSVALPLKFELLALENARDYHGKQFPIGFALDSSAPTPPIETSEEYLRQIAHSGRLTELLKEHGAVLFRGFGHASAETFSRLVIAAERGRNNTPYEQVGLAGKRSEQAPEVFTANEGPQSQRFYQHNEYARYTRFPGFIHFYCAVAPLEGGESPIANSLELFERVSAELPEFVAELQKRGLAMKQIYPAPYFNDGKSNYFDWTGPDTFGHEILPGDDEATKRVKAEKQVRRLTPDFRWLDNGGIEIVQHVPGRHGTARDAGALEPPYLGNDGKIYPQATYGDGTPIPRQYLDRLLDISIETEFSFKWEEGDIIFVDNYRTTHGRRPWTKGGRKVLVSMWNGLAGALSEY